MTTDDLSLAELGELLNATEQCGGPDTENTILMRHALEKRECQEIDQITAAISREYHRLVGDKARLLIENLRLSKEIAELESARDEATP